MHPHSATLSAAALLVLLVAGCGDRDSDADTTDPTTASAAPTSAAPTSAPPTTPPSGALEKIRVVGAVVQVGDCVVVQDDNATTWTVTGQGADALALGDRVQVTGSPDLAATGCGGPLVQARTITVVG